MGFFYYGLDEKSNIRLFFVSFTGLGVCVPSVRCKWPAPPPSPRPAPFPYFLFWFKEKCI